MMKRILLTVVAVVFALSVSADAKVLLYEPFAYDSTALTGQGGAFGTTGVWNSAAQNDPLGWQVHQEGTLSGAMWSDGVTPITYDGTFDCLWTLGGYAGHGSAGYKLNADIGLAARVTNSFKSGSTTWLSYVSVVSFEKNYELPNLTLGTIPAPTPSRGDTYGGIGTGGDGIGTGGGPNRDNRRDIYPMFYDAGQYMNMQGAIPGNSYSGNPDTFVDDTGRFVALTDVANLVVMKIEWDADGGKDIISLGRFLEGDTDDRCGCCCCYTEAAFDAMILAKPNLTSANWADEDKPDIDQSTLDTITFAGIKYFVDEIRIGTTFCDVTPCPEPMTVALLGLGGLGLIRRKRK